MRRSSPTLAIAALSIAAMLIGACNAAAPSSVRCNTPDCLEDPDATIGSDVDHDFDASGLPDGGSDAGLPDVPGDTPVTPDTEGDAVEETSPDVPLPDIVYDTPEPQDADTGPCPGGRPANGCGGCRHFGYAPGEPCGVCGDGVWTCDGTDDIVCTGAVASRRDFWRDADRDGFGDPETLPFAACEAPPNWVENDDDCDDAFEEVFPGALETCDGRDEDCDGEIDEAPDIGRDCRDSCCDEGLACVEGECLLRCDEGERCGEELELCCTGEAICYANACAEPGDLCAFTEDCALDEICEPLLGICLPRAVVPPCEFVPPVGDFDPRLGCRWQPGPDDPHRGWIDVVATPVVINLTDDNGDGLTDENDDPEIAFLSYDLDNGCCNRPGALRVVRGGCNDDGTMTTIATIDEPQLNNDVGIAAGDLDHDGVPELVAIMRQGGAPQGTVAFSRAAEDGSDWDVLWTNPDYPSQSHTRGGAVIGIHNLDAAGAPEIVIGNVVLAGDDGRLLWDGIETSEGDGGIGNNAFLGPTSAVADVNLDGFLEVMAGNTLYGHDGEVLWTWDYTTSNSGCGGSLPCDGFNAVGNFDDDPFGELVAVRRGEVFVWEHDGELIWQARIPRDDCASNESGPPTVADFDGDGFPEIGTASADFYVVLDMNTCSGDDWEAAGCRQRNILWRVANNDCSSRATGSSVFDFEGDGRAEVVYADERNFRIFDGITGAVLYDDATHGSHTRIEMPVIADVDNDGNAEVVIPENRWGGGRPGIDVWEDRSDNWVRTRRVWNQHGYSITHVEEDGTIPFITERNWSNPRYNNYRQNVQPAGVFDAPDLSVDTLRLAGETCPLESLRISVIVSNDGALSVPPGVPVQVFIDAGGVELGLERVATTTRLFPGDSETISFDVTIPPDAPDPPFTVRAVVDPDLEVSECDEDNNARATTDVGCYPFP